MVRGRDRPNILLVVSDQQRPDMVGALGRVPVRTPALDRLCAEGVAFERAYAATPLCTPSRHGAWSVGVDTPDDILSLPHLLADGAGYRTAIVGKSHFKSARRPGSFEALPHSRDWAFFARWSGPWFGFARARICIGHTFEEHAYGMHYGLWLRERGVEARPPYFEAGPTGRIGRREEGRPFVPAGPWALPAELHSSAWVADETIAFLREHQRAGKRPFYLCVNFPDPHPPFSVPAPWHGRHAAAPLPPPVRTHGEWADKPTLYGATIERRLDALGWHDRVRPAGQSGWVTPSDARTPEEECCWRAHLDMTSLLDRHLGRILDALDELDLARDTLVVFTSDHGDYLGDHFLWGKGGSHYDAAVRVPFIVRWPGRAPAGARGAALQSLVDLAPTFLAAAGLAPHPAMQGLNQLPSWSAPDRGVRAGVLIDHRVERGLYVNSWITDRYRLSLHALVADGRDEIEVYDLRDDPGEFTNLAARGGNRDLVGGLLSELLRYRLAMAGPWAERATFS